jgi:hypothetical protein
LLIKKILTATLIEKAVMIRKNIVPPIYLTL